ncbi:MAG: hypothetical protein LAO55_06135 [Acidobacteriia bacterium]|nr:hypothetical protein [Terriglobia bacterium]
MVLVQLLLLGSLILIITAPIVFLVLAFVHLRTRSRGREVIALAFVLGSCAGGFLVWNLAPSGWSMSFWTTLQASVNAEKYGHPIEHAAENILVVVTFASVLCGLLSASAAAFGAKLLARPKHG